MRSNYYLAIPLVATLLDIMFAVTLIHVHSSNAVDIPATQEIPAVAETSELLNLCGVDDGDQVCGASLDTGAHWAPMEHEPDEEDPMLQPMPGMPDFKAYIRQDISTFYREEPGSRTEQEPSFRGQAGKFVNMSPERLSLYW